MARMFLVYLIGTLCAGSLFAADRNNDDEKAPQKTFVKIEPISSVSYAPIEQPPGLSYAPVQQQDSEMLGRLLALEEQANDGQNLVNAADAAWQLGMFYAEKNNTDKALEFFKLRLENDETLAE